jgi:hypothetical protein
MNWGATETEQSIALPGDEVAANEGSGVEGETRIQGVAV